MMINNLKDLDLFSTWYSLTQFIVIHQYELAGNRFDQIGLCEDANQFVIIVHNHECSCIG